MRTTPFFRAISLALTALAELLFLAPYVEAAELAEDLVLDCNWRKQQALAVLAPPSLGWRGAPAWPGALGTKEIRDAAASGAQSALAARPMVSGLHGCGVGNRILADAIDEARTPLADPPGRSNFFERIRARNQQRKAQMQALDEALSINMRGLQAPRAILMLDVDLEWQRAPAQMLVKILSPRPQVIKGRLALCSSFLAAGDSPSKPEAKPHCMLLRNVRVEADGAVKIPMQSAAGDELASLPPSERRVWLMSTTIAASAPMNTFPQGSQTDVESHDGTVEVADGVSFLFTRPSTVEGQETARAIVPIRPGRGGASPLSSPRFLAEQDTPAVKGEAGNVPSPAVLNVGHTTDDVVPRMRLAPQRTQGEANSIGPIRIDLTR